VGSVQPYQTKKGRRYLIRYFKPDGTQAAKRGFLTKRSAEDYLSSVATAIAKREYLDPAHARITIGDLAPDWLQNQAAVLKPSSLHPLESAWRIHVEPRWGHVRVGDVRYSDVRAWVTEVSAHRSASTVIRAHGVLAAILDGALRDRRIPENPARGIKLPRKQPKRRVYLTHAQVDQLAAASKHPEVVYFLSYTGVRWGEATGLRVADLDPNRRRVHVRENAVMVNGKVHTGTPKTHVSRSVPYPDFLDRAIRALALGKSADMLLFGDGIQHLRLPNSQAGWFANAVRRVREADATFPVVTPHDLRHTAASLAISAGANVKAVQRMLGHASAAMTLDTYADLFEDDLDYVADALSRARLAAPMITVTETGPRGPGI
jgi:integrase